ncbi:cell wall-binding protein [Methylomagnum ishizawai]|uniref:cell wall-binding protein n=1 Tax=Methylomagnum ishizawai TaxID=1760988 RepID=UPI001C32F612|nr:cell wall-binding protein [Methylomagnum ishizawai]BBL73009.1 hypothetical protein MishRS11D_01070 [Methylomagnum ishizawai]
MADEKDNQGTIKLVIDNASKPTKRVKKTADTQPSKATSESRARYLVHEGRICKLDGDLRKPLCNFQARIVEEVLHDDGETAETLFSIEGQLWNGRNLPRIEVSASSFAGLGWVTARWGAGAIVHAGSAVKDQLREALQELSADIKQRTVYTHTGWRLLDGGWRYLHGAGAIGADGNREGVEVFPGQGHMRLYRLPPPPEGVDLAPAVRASLGLLDLAPNRPDLGAYLLGATYRAPTAEAAPIDHGGWLFGTTGNFKSEAAALSLAHFGEFDGRHLTANFTDSEGNIEYKSYSAKDALFLVDDFKPIGGANEVNKLHAKADRIFRGVGNQAGRGTLTANRKERAAYYARGMVLATGEDLPRGQSLRARLTITELAKGDIDRERLSQLQRAARGGLFRQAMAAYLRWLAPQMQELKVRLPELIRHFRDQAISTGFASAHARTASDYASLKLGLSLFIEFATESGVLASAEASDFEARAEGALRDLMARQGDNQAEENEVRRFFTLLRSALSAGRCHVSDRHHQGPPEVQPHAWGWRAVPAGPLEGTTKETKPQGSCIGWTDGKTLWLDGDAAFAIAQVYAREQGGLFEIGKITLWKRVHEAKLLMACTHEKGRFRKLTVKRRIAGVQTPVYELAATVFESMEE